MPIGKKINWEKFDNLINDELPNYTIKEFSRKFLPDISPKAVGSRAKKLKIKPGKHQKTKGELKKLSLIQMKETPEMVLYIKNNINIKDRKEISEILKISYSTLERIISRNNIRLSDCGRARINTSRRLKNLGKIPWNKGKKLPQEMIKKIRFSNKKLSTDEFIEKTKKVHGDKYDYSKVQYVNFKTKITIICPIHGEFEQRASLHLGGSQCPKCNIDRMLLGNEEFIKRANKKHQNTYNYSKVDYKNINTKVTIICPKHDEFKQEPKAHLSGQGCPQCSGNGKYLVESFENKSKKVHGNKYNYSKSKYRGAHNKTTIICSEHGEFEQTPNGHLKGQGCPICGRQKVIKSHFLDTNKFIKRAINIHDNKYDYLKVDYTSSKDKITIICPTHGEFVQIPNDHLQGHGCPYCTLSVSSGHKEIVDYLKSILDDEILINNRSAIDPYELDIYIPEKKLAIEYNGLFWHSYDRNETTEERNRHKHKCELCEDKDIRLIQINENEWINKKEVVKSVLKSKLGMSDGIFARKCVIKEINPKQHKEFMDKYHLQGQKGASVRLGLFHQEELVSVMSFNKHPKYQWEITRFANKLDTTVVGGASKVFKYFMRNYDPDQVLTYADRRYSDGNLYRKLGFELTGYTSPNYCYIKNKKTYSRQQFQKHKLKDRLEIFDPNITEAENMFNDGFRRIWDAGHYRFLHQRSN